MKVCKVGEIVKGVIYLVHNRGVDLPRILSNMKPAQEARPEAAWKVPITLGTGPSEREVLLNLPPVISTFDSLDHPLFLADYKIVFFRDRLFVPERPPRDAEEREEIALRVKKAIYDEEADIKNLKAAVANLEAAIEYNKSGPRRNPIPEDVKLHVWARDGGACARCGSRKGLQFDHIIPLAKGGADVEGNIQILCQQCNLKKADKIAP
jgi:hypothetical protein